MYYVIRADEPFAGSVQSVILPDGTVAYSGGLTPDAYAEARGFPVKIVNGEELDGLVSAHVASMVTDATEETEKQFMDALSVLPPARWTTYQGVEAFHVSEAITYDLVEWHCRIGDRYFVFNDRATLPPDHIARKVREGALRIVTSAEK